MKSVRRSSFSSKCSLECFTLRTQRVKLEGAENEIAIPEPSRILRGKGNLVVKTANPEAKTPVCRQEWLFSVCSCTSPAHPSRAPVERTPQGGIEKNLCVEI
jgi:hypothetical protein